MAQCYIAPTIVAFRLNQLCLVEHTVQLPISASSLLHLHSIKVTVHLVANLRVVLQLDVLYRVLLFVLARLERLVCGASAGESNSWRSTGD